MAFEFVKISGLWQLFTFESVTFIYLLHIKLRKFNLRSYFWIQASFFLVNIQFCSYFLDRSANSVCTAGKTIKFTQFSVP